MKCLIPPRRDLAFLTVRFQLSGPGYQRRAASVLSRCFVQKVFPPSRSADPLAIQLIMIRWGVDRSIFYASYSFPRTCTSPLSVSGTCSAAAGFPHARHSPIPAQLSTQGSFPICILPNLIPPLLPTFHHTRILYTDFPCVNKKMEKCFVNRKRRGFILSRY